MRQVMWTVAVWVWSVILGVTGASATAVSLAEWAFNLDGVLTTAPGPIPGAIRTSSFNFTTGLGSIRVTLNSAGAHFVGVFLDHDLDDAVFDDEFGRVNELPASGQSWEIDEPGFGLTNPGNIFALFTDSNATASQLDNTNTVPDGSLNDVSMALGWNFHVMDGESAVVSFLVSRTAPAAGFFLAQVDPDSQEAIYFVAELRIGPTAVPEPGTMVLLASGLLGLTLWRHQRWQRHR